MKGNDNDKNHNYSLPMSKEEVLSLRQKHFCERVSISYLNSDPLMIVGGEQSHLIDSNGISYLDTRNNVCHVGHQCSEVVRAVQTQVATLNTNTRYLHPNVTILASKLATLLPDPLEICFFVNSGSEANDLALRLARAYSCKNTIVISHGYHGHTLGTLEVSPYKYKKSKEFSKTPVDHVYEVPCPDLSYKGEYYKTMKEKNPSFSSDNICDEDAAEFYSQYVTQACQHFSSKNSKVGSLIIESGMSVAGVIIPPKGYLSKCAEYVRDAGGLVIADEVQTGFGRFGKCMWGFEYNDEDFIPDIVTVGKSFGNGMPLAAVITTREVSKAFKECGVEYFNTFGGNPVSAAAGLAVLEVLEKEELQKHALHVGEYLRNSFEKLSKQKEFGIIGDCRGSGLFLGVELVSHEIDVDDEGRETTVKKPASKETSFICTVLKEKYHVLTSIDGPHENVLVIKPPMVFSVKDADEFLDYFKRAVLEDLSQVENIHEIDTTPT